MSGPPDPSCCRIPIVIGLSGTSAKNLYANVPTQARNLYNKWPAREDLSAKWTLRIRNNGPLQTARYGLILT